MARWRASQWVSEIGSDDLLFSHDESMQFLEQTMGLKLDPELAQTLESRTEGWIAGLQMAALSVQQHARSDRVVAEKITTFNGQHHYVLDYLATEVIAAATRNHPFVPAQDRHPRPSLRSAVRCSLGRADSNAILARLEQSNMFLQRLDDNRQWFRYHQLFADFLRTGLDAAAKRELHGKARAWHEAHGSGKDAIRHALAAKDVPAAVRLFRSQVENMLARGEIAALLGWLDALPESTIRAHGDLAGYKAWLLYLLGRTAEAQAYSPAMNGVDPDDSRSRATRDVARLQGIPGDPVGRNGGRQAVRPASPGRTGRQRVVLPRLRAELSGSGPEPFR